MDFVGSSIKLTKIPVGVSIFRPKLNEQSFLLTFLRQLPRRDLFVEGQRRIIPFKANKIKKPMKKRSKLLSNNKICPIIETAHVIIVRDTIVYILLANPSTEPLEKRNQQQRQTSRRIKLHQRNFSNDVRLVFSLCNY